VRPEAEAGWEADQYVSEMDRIFKGGVLEEKMKKNEIRIVSMERIVSDIRNRVKRFLTKKKSKKTKEILGGIKSRNASCKVGPRGGNIRPRTLRKPCHDLNGRKSTDENLTQSNRRRKLEDVLEPNYMNDKEKCPSHYKTKKRTKNREPPNA